MMPFCGTFVIKKKKRNKFQNWIEKWNSFRFVFSRAKRYSFVLYSFFVEKYLLRKGESRFVLFSFLLYFNFKSLFTYNMQLRYIIITFINEKYKYFLKILFSSKTKKKQFPHPSSTMHAPPKLCCDFPFLDFFSVFVFIFLFLNY